MGRTLDKIEVNGFKSIRSMSLELGRLNVLIGANGVGKSNFIELFRLLSQIVEGNLQVYVGSRGGANNILHFGRQRTDEIKLVLAFAEKAKRYECVLVPTTDDSLVFKQESCWFIQPERVTKKHIKRKTIGNALIGNGHAESRIFQSNEKPARQILSDLKSWKVYHFHDTSESAPVKQTSDLEDNRILRPNAANLAAFLYLLKKRHPASYTNIVDAVRLVFPFFDDFTLEPSRLNPDKIRLEWRELGSDVYFNASALSDGSLRFICLATLLLQPVLPSTILLDEPELGLHPYAITILAELLRGAATKTQVIASTQSVSLVNQFEPEDVIVVEREDQQSVFRHLDRADMLSWLDDYGLGDLWEKNILGGRP